MYNWNLRKNSFSLPLPLIFLAQCASFFAEARPLRADAQPKLLELMSVNKIDCSKATQSEKTKCDDC